MTAAYAAPKQRGRPFAKGTSGNPAGKRPGTRNKATIAAELLLDGEAEKLTRKAIALALRGDTAALRLCMERVIPVRRERRIQFQLPELRCPGDAVTAMAAIAEAVANGDLSVGEASELSKLIESFARTLEIENFDQRLKALEARGGSRPGA